MFYLNKAVMQLDDSVGATFSAINYCTTATNIKTGAGSGLSIFIHFFSLTSCCVDIKNYLDLI
jgi:hypothetical protein